MKNKNENRSSVKRDFYLFKPLFNKFNQAKQITKQMSGGVQWAI